METRKSYGTVGDIRPECLVHAKDWVEPTGAELLIAIRMAGITAEAFGRLIGVAGRTVRRWLDENDSSDIPYAAWVVLCQEAGLGNILHAKPLAHSNKE